MPCPGNMRVLVLDTTGFLAAIQLAAYRDLVYTTPSVLEEVRDSASTERLIYTVASGRLEVAEPSSRARKTVEAKAREIGEKNLSSTDIDVASLALDLAHRGCKVLVVTDDYALQNLLSHLGIEYMPLRTRGIKERRRYRIICPACGYQTKNPKETTCPVCGTPLVKKRV